MPSDTKQRPPNYIVLREVILSFPQLFVPKQILGQGDPKYGACFLIDPNTQSDQLDAIVRAIEAAANSEKGWPKGEWKAKRALKDDAVFHWPLSKGEARGHVNGYLGRYYVNAKSNEKPGVVDQSVQPVLDASKIYPGLIVNASISFFPYKIPRWGVGCGLNGIQIVRDGERLGGRPDPTADFSPIAGSFTGGEAESGNRDWMN